MKLWPFSDSSDTRIGYVFWCPGCAEYHMYFTSHSPLRTQGPNWKFNDDIDCPTFTPSLLSTWNAGENNLSPRICHLFVTDGKIIYCGDCTHSFAGKTVDMVDEPEGGAS